LETDVAVVEDGGAITARRDGDSGSLRGFPVTPAFSLGERGNCRPVVWQIGRPWRVGKRPAGLETRDTADWEVCATRTWDLVGQIMD